jgi:hypothetical protein
MRNLKKVLALVLALAMALSVMASAFTAPALSEEAQAEYDAMTAAQQNAFYLVEALGIVNGYPDGSFKPDATLTRAEFAKMIYVAKTGANDASNLFASSSIAMFSDAADITANASWAIPYIAYAYSTGIIAGYNDGSFKANGNVTGLEAAKMLLTALGYEAEIEGLVGPTFKASTIALASRVGLLKGVVGDLEAPATRADAFVMVANAIAANTVSYVGGVAAPKTETLNSLNTITLGEEGFDLLDVEAVLVANSDVALGAYWRNILKNSTATAYYGELIDYRLYQAAPAGYARFVYRDYAAADAANEGAYYYDRVITVALGDQAAKFAELGEMYRILVTDIADVYNNNEYRVLYGYPVEQANDAYYKVTTGEVNGLKAAVIDAMQARYAAVNGEDNEEAIDNTIFVNGAAVSFKAAKAYAGKASTAPYKAVDNDNDGVVDALFIADYTISQVISIDGTSVKLQGIGTKTLANAADLAAGDYVAYYADKDTSFAKKLDVYEGNVTGYNGSAWTINGAAKVAGAYMSAASKSLMGSGEAALTETVYKFVFDGKYIVNIDVTENTRYAKYAIVESFEWLGFHGLNHDACITLYTEDNERITGYVGSIDGEKVTKDADGDIIDTLYNNLVSYKVDGDYIYIDTLNNNSFDDSELSTDYEFVYNRATDTWEGLTTNGIISFKDTYGVVFVSYMNGLMDDGKVSYRAYLDGEFMPSYYNAFEANVRDGIVADEVVFVKQNSVNYIKAAKINFAHFGLDLPGLPATRANDNIVIVKANSVVNVVDGKYVYEIETFDPWATTATKYETVAFIADQRNNLPTVGGVYNFKTNADGKLTAWEAVGPVITSGNTDYDRSDMFELEAYVATGINLNPSNAIIALSGVVDTENNYFASFPINYSADADVWFFEIADGKITAQDWTSYVEYDYNNDNTNDEYIVYADINEMTQTAQRIIVIKGAYADEVAQPELTFAVEATYNPNTKTITYAPVNDNDIPTWFIGIAEDLLAEYAAKEAKIYPWSTEFAARNVMVFTFENVNGIWAVKAGSGVGIGDVVEYSAEDGTQFIDVSKNLNSFISVQGEDNEIIVKNGDTFSVWMYRENDPSQRLDLLYEYDNAKAFTDLWDDFVDAMNDSTVEYNSTASANTAYNYEKMIVVYDLDGEVAEIIFVDTSADYDVANKFPYAAATDSTPDAVVEDDAEDPVQDSILA